MDDPIDIYQSGADAADAEVMFCTFIRACCMTTVYRQLLYHYRWLRLAFTMRPRPWTASSQGDIAGWLLSSFDVMELIVATMFTIWRSSAGYMIVVQGFLWIFVREVTNRAAANIPLSHQTTEIKIPW